MSRNPQSSLRLSLACLLLPLCGSGHPYQQAPTREGNAQVIPGLLIAWAQQSMNVAFECDATHYRSRQEPSRRAFIINRSNDLAYFGYGTASGITGYTEDGTPLYGLEEARLASADGEWRRNQRSIAGDFRLGDVSNARVGVIDIRSTGFVPNSLCQTYSPQGCIEHLAKLLQCNSLEFRERQIEGDPVVEAYCEERQRRIAWRFDSEHSGRLMRVEDWHAERRIAAVEFEYGQESDLSNLPTKVLFLDGDDRVQALTELGYRNVNSSGIPDPISPAHIGFLPGSPVTVEGDGPSKRMVWAGDRLVSREEYDDLKRRGLIEDDPQIVAWLERAKARGPIDINAQRRTADIYGKPSTEPIVVPRPDAGWRHRITPLLKAPDQSDEWTRYVEDFIRTYKLDQDQAARCRQFLAEALDRRAQYLRSRRERLQGLAEREYKTSGDARLGQEELALLLRPVDRLFDDLKARLRPVPTRKQRADAGETRESGKADD